MKYSIVFMFTGLILFAYCSPPPISPQPPEPLFAPTWELVRYTSGIGETSPISGSRITLSLSGDTLRGRAGCNDYFGSWEYRGADSMAVSGQIGTTEMFCEHFMKQEQLYLYLLSESTRFLVRDDRLVLSGRPGRLIFRKQRPDGAPPEPETALFTGYFTAGNEVSVFRDCADTTFTYWLNDETNTLDSLYHLTTEKREYQPVLLTIEALKEPRLNLGYASEHDGLIRVQSILQIEKPDPEDPCFSNINW